jgi:hypothetical protein
VRTGPLPQRRARRVDLRSDSGSATLEGAGMWGLAALLAASIALVFLAASPGVGDTVRRAVCIVVTLGQGDCSGAAIRAAEREPQTPCVVSASGHESRVQGTFLFVSAETGDQWLVEELSDGRFRVTRGTGGGLGAEAGVGATVQVVWDDKAYGVAAAAGVGATATFRSGEVYYAGSTDEVASLLRRHQADVVKDNTVGGSGPVRWVVDQVDGLFGGKGNLPAPSERYVEGGVALGADAKATWIVAGANAEVQATQVLGARVGSDGSTTEYLASTVSGEVAAGTWGGADDGSYEYAQLKAGGSVQVVTEIERDAEGTVTAVRTRVVTAGEAAATTTSAGTTSGPSKKGYAERVAELPVRDDADRQVAMAYLRALGVQQVAGMSVPVPASVSPTGVFDVVRYAEAVKARGTLTEQSFDDDGSRYGAEVSGEIIAKVGGAGELTTIDRRSTGGQYFDGTGWQPWTACG